MMNASPVASTSCGLWRAYVVIFIHFRLPDFLVDPESDVIASIREMVLALHDLLRGAQFGFIDT
jgi:hypothetical protein